MIELAGNLNFFLCILFALETNHVCHSLATSQVDILAMSLKTTNCLLF